MVTTHLLAIFCAVDGVLGVEGAGDVARTDGALTSGAYRVMGVGAEEESANGHTDT